MKNLSLPILAIAALAIAAPITKAQTYTGLVDLPDGQEFNCGSAGAVICKGLPLLVSNGSSSVKETVWFSQYSASNFVVWPVDPLGLDNSTGLAHFTSPDQGIKTGPGTHQLDLTFAGTTGNGTPYSGTFVLYYTTYFQSGRGGGWKWVVTGGKITVNVV